MSKPKKTGITIIHSGPSIFEVAHEVHNVTVRHCDYCGKPMNRSDVNDYGSLCESCYMKEYYGKEGY
jgi:hypothetical protein